MKVLVVAATEMEIAPFIKDNISAEVLITGVGTTPITFHLTRKLLTNTYDWVIQAGIAGSCSATLKPAQVVAVSEDTFGDVGILENNKFKTLFDTGLAHKDDFPFTNGWLQNTNHYPSENLYKKVRALTVNTVSDKPIIKDQSEFKAEIESMEGASFHYVCLCQHVQFLQLRSISNEVGIRDKNKWYIKEAISNLNVALTEMVQKLIDRI